MIYSMPRRRLNSLAIGLFLLAVFAGCTGPAGPDGDNAVLTDSIPPAVTWLFPDPGSSVDSLVWLKAKATDDQSLWKMHFYIAGSEFIGTMKDAADSAAHIYSYQWKAFYYPEGDYPLSARAYDSARNQTVTPTIMVSVKH